MFTIILLYMYNYNIYDNSFLFVSAMTFQSQNLLSKGRAFYYMKIIQYSNTVVYFIQDCRKRPH